MKMRNFFLNLPIIKIFLAPYDFASAKEHLMWSNPIDFPSNHHYNEYNCAISLFELCEAVEQKTTGTDQIAVSRSDWESINVI